RCRAVRLSAADPRDDTARQRRQQDHLCRSHGHSVLGRGARTCRSAGDRLDLLGALAPMARGTGPQCRRRPWCRVLIGARTPVLRRRGRPGPAPVRKISGWARERASFGTDSTLLSQLIAWVNTNLASLARTTSERSLQTDLFQN